MRLILLALALAIPVEDVTLPNGVRVIVSLDRAAARPAVAVARDHSVVAVVATVDGEAARAPYLSWPRPSPEPASPLPAPESESWQVRAGSPRLVVEWAAPENPGALLALQPWLWAGGSLERSGAILRLVVEGGWPAATRRELDAQLARLQSAGPRELAAVRDACAAWATPKTPDERAQRLLQVTLATGNPRLVRDLPESCARLTAAGLAAAARGFGPRGRRVILVTQTAP